MNMTFQKCLATTAILSALLTWNIYFKTLLKFNFEKKYPVINIQRKLFEKICKITVFVGKTPRFNTCMGDNLMP